MDLIFECIAELIATLFLEENNKDNLTKRQKISLYLSCFLIILFIIKLFFYYESINLIALSIGAITTIGSILSLRKLFKTNNIKNLIVLIFNFIIGILLVYIFNVTLSIDEILALCLEPLMIITIYFLTKKSNSIND